jgi:hypothetical protein
MWTRPADNGGANLIGYKVYVSQGESEYVEVANAESLLNPAKEYHLHTATDLVTGEIYRFRVTAYNPLGEGKYAQLVTHLRLDGEINDYVIAADLPESPLNPPNLVQVN